MRIDRMCMSPDNAPRGNRVQGQNVRLPSKTAVAEPPDLRKLSAVESLIKDRVISIIDSLPTKSDLIGKRVVRPAKDQIRLDSRFIEDLGMESLDMVEMIMSLEEQFQISIPDEKIAPKSKDRENSGFKTVGDIVNYITPLVSY